MAEEAPAPDQASTLSFSKQEHLAGRVLYFILVASIVIVVTGLAWSIADWLQPTGKFDSFVAMPWGAKIAIIGVMFFVFFLLLIAFYQLYAKGTSSITKILFSAKKLYADSKITMLAKLVTGGLMVSVLLTTAGIVLFVIEAAVSGGEPGGVAAFMASLTGGETVLLVGTFCTIFTVLAISFAWLWNVGNIFFAQKFFKA